MPALTAGLSVFALLTMFHYVTVAHISPTVTFGFALAGIFDYKMVVPYVLAQALGAICGASLAMVLFFLYYTVGSQKVQCFSENL